MKAKGVVKKIAKTAAKKLARKIVKAAVAPKKKGKVAAPKRTVSKEPALPHLRERWPRTEKERKALATEEYRRLAATYPDAHCALDFTRSPYQLLVATILSAQCTDKRVNMVTPALFERYPNADGARGCEAGGARGG